MERFYKNNGLFIDLAKVSCVTEVEEDDWGYITFLIIAVDGVSIKVRKSDHPTLSDKINECSEAFVLELEEKIKSLEE